jgi:hypothetical protein
MLTKYSATLLVVLATLAVNTHAIVKDTKPPTLPRCTTFESYKLCTLGPLRRQFCNWDKTNKACLVTPTIAPTPAPTVKCTNYKKKFGCTMKKNKGKCMWTGKVCERVTSRPTPADGGIDCGRYTKVAGCRLNAMVRERCVWDKNVCIRRTPAPTPLVDCTKFEKLAGCRLNDVTRANCFWDSKNKKCVPRTPAPTPTEVNCETYKKKYGCLMNKARKENCVWVDGACGFKTAYPTNEPTKEPTTARPTNIPTAMPTRKPTVQTTKPKDTADTAEGDSSKEDSSASSLTKGRQRLDSPQLWHWSLLCCKY